MVKKLKLQEMRVVIPSRRSLAAGRPLGFLGRSRAPIARALANKPRIILADEPTAPLDSARARIVMDLLRRIAVDQKAAIIVVTHDEMILDRFDHIYRLRDGRLEAQPLSAATLQT
jgi:putative ABC transport system ATP-binding protein